MKRMWSDSLLGRLVESRSKYREPRDLLGGFERLNNFGPKDSFFRRAKSHYSLLNTHYCKLIFLFTLISVSACNSDSKKAETHQQYTCSMHPQIVEDGPGSCPICGMDLTPIRGQHQATHSADSILAIGNNPEHATVTMVVKDVLYSPDIALDGTVTYNTNQVKSISARVSGRIEKSFVKYNFEPVKKGQLLLKVYSEDLVAIQQEMLYLKSQNDTDLLNKTKTKLSLLGVSTQQINQILQSGKADYTINIYSNYDGYLLNPDASNEGGFQSANTPLNIKEGQYINSGDLLFKVFNNSNLWAEFYTNTLESEWLKVGTALNLNINGQSIKSKVDFIQPFFKNNQNYKVIRVVLNNQKHHYKIGELAKATSTASPIRGLWIPQQAVYQSGEKSLVYIKIENSLKPMEVQVSAKAGDNILVKKGLASGDEIAANASYLIDSESFINSK
ncbi:HlyD family efflux transporter periplasmic adaptor subunit [Pedobacter arcticus]|uniref:HlyD family efflux transporter periplasmic adaptor subunit n=1 Tax=Pedobacter arcticus TaxID=752140 RepID=UPI0013760F8C|nr:HlyD family efflux transporter periplasmic adaptor subunit [Pedobacter arcticus]